jgi:hypothetical protein
MAEETTLESMSLSALCTDFYINQKLALKMDVPTGRESVLDMFDRVRKDVPTMDRFRRYDGELALESAEDESHYCWMALRRTSIRSGWVNPESLEQAYKLHRLILEISPFFLSISALDVEYIELVFGFDLRAPVNRNEVVFEALVEGSPLAGLVDLEQESVLEAQPLVGFSLSPSCDHQAFVEVKTRVSAQEVAQGRFEDQPISVYLTVRRYASMGSITELASTFGALAGHAERLAEDRVIPYVIQPIRDALYSRPE